MNGIITKNELREKIDNLRLYLNNDTIFYLNSLLNLEVSVFKQEKYNEVLHKLDIFMDLAYYNICLIKISGVDDKLLWPRNTWTDKEEYDRVAKKLAGKFVEHFKQFQVPGLPDYSPYGPHAN